MVLGLREYPILIKGYKKVVTQKKYDIVHITSSASISLLKDLAMVNIARRKGIKSIIHFRFGRIPELHAKKNWEYKLLLAIIQRVDVAIVIDQTSYDTLKNEGYNNIELIPNPVTPEIQKIINRNLNIVREERKILFAGHAKVTKGVYELIEACKNIDNITVKLIGEVTEEARLKILKTAGKDNSWLCIAGQQDYETTIKEMLSAGVFVLPTYTEGFPNVILESMACACPIVASAVGAIPEMLNVNDPGNFGICVEPKNIEELTEAINKMLENPEFAKECGENAQKRVNKLYSMPIVWSQLTNLWKSLLN
jgi:glycosyltransferase involved in cell wall biosynthesis